MATITLTIPNAAVNQAINDICTYFNYQAQIPQAVGPPIPNPETQTAFAKRMVLQEVVGWLKQVEGTLAQQNARATSDATIDALGITVS